MPKSNKTRATVGWEGHFKELEISVPEGDPAPWDAHSSLILVGQRIPRIDAVAKVTGRAKYTYDINLPGMLYARILRSPFPSARVTKLDISKAKSAPGVRAVWAEKAGKKVSFQGQEIAAVAAVSPEAAEEALRHIQIEWERRPFVVDADKARAKDAPQVFDAPVPPPRRLPPGAEVTQAGNVRTISSTRPPGVDIAKAFAEAEVTVEGSFRTQVQTHSALETHGAVAKWEGDHLTIWSSTQATFGVRDQVAQALKLPKDKVRVLCDFMGGGFGAKFGAGPHTIIAARLARDARAPVKLMLSRQEEQLCTGNRPDSVQWIKLGARKDGTLVALYLKSYGTPGVGTGAGTGGPARSLYNIKSMRIEESDVFTNTGEAQPFRAPGHPQGCFALEQAMDELAEKLGMDPLALRKKNLANPVQVGEVDQAAQRAGAKWTGRGKPGSSPGSKKRGIGVACGVWYKIVSPSTQVQIDIHDDGRVEVKNGAQDIGTGTKTYMAQITAEELGISLDLVTVRMGDTTLPMGPGSGGSTTTPSIAPTVRSAAQKARERMLELASKQLKLDSDELTIADGRIQGIRDLARSLSWKQVASRIAGKLSVLATRAGEYESFQNQTGGVQMAEVEVDVETGAVRVVRVTAIHDCGRVLNPLLAESQVNGGVIQGVSYALYENRQLDRTTGRMCNPNLESYKILGAPDCPDIDSVLLEVSNAGNNAGVAGLGEPTTVPTCAAVANAVYHAIGVRMRELPITPDRVLAALSQRGRK